MTVSVHLSGHQPLETICHDLILYHFLEISQPV